MRITEEKPSVQEGFSEASNKYLLSTLTLSLSVSRKPAAYMSSCRSESCCERFLRRKQHRKLAQLRRFHAVLFYSALPLFALVSLRCES